MQRQVVTIVACLWATAAVAAQPSTPYKAYVVVEEAYVRSGPGEGFYPTEKVRFGREVEVYQRDAAGWCAIRPLEESFSWVPSWDIRLGDDGLAEVATESVGARIGSQFSDVRDVVQVRLKRGELVELLGWKRMGSGASAQTWYRIAPPAGEFRWIHERFLDLHPPQARIVRAARQSPPADSAPGEVQPAVALQPTQAPERPSAATSGTIPPSAGPPPGVSQPAAVPPARDAPAGTGGPSAIPTPVAKGPVSGEDFQAELDDINTELALMLAEEPSVWNCEELIRRTESLLSVAQTSSQRAHARLLLNRLARAAGVKKRFDAVYRIGPVPASSFAGEAAVQALVGETPAGTVQPVGSREALGHADRAPSPPPADRPLSPAGPQRTNTPYDAMGKLTRVMPGRMGGPRYALLDDHGRVACYVSPAPGVGLQHYVGRRVGITGTRHAGVDLVAPHVTARHVTPLDSSYRR